MVLAGGYWAFARLGQQFTDSTTHVSALWPASGLALGMFAVHPRRRWPVLVLAVFAGNLVAEAQSHSVGWQAFALAAIDAVEPVVVCTVLLRVGGEAVGVRSVRRVWALIAAAAANAPTALLGTAVLTGSGAGSFGRGFVSWWLANGTAIVVLTPVVLAALGRPHRLSELAAPEQWAIVAVFVLLGGLVFLGDSRSPDPVTGYGFVLLGPAVWAAVRARESTIAASISLVGLIGAWGTAHGHGPFAASGVGTPDRFLTVQTFLVLGGGLLLGMAAVVHERRQAMAALQTSEEGHRRAAYELETLLESTEEAIYGVDASGRITFVNRAAAEQTGYRREEMLGRHAHDLLHHSRADGTPYPREECPLFEVRAGGGSSRGAEEVFWRADGTPYPVEYTSSPLYKAGGVVGAVVTIIDITERRRAEQRLQEAEARFRQAFTGAPVGIMLVSLEGRLIDANEALCEFLEYEHDELVGLPLSAIMHPSDLAVRNEAIAVVLGGETPSVRLELRYLTATGRTAVGLMQARLIGDGNATGRYLITHVVDVTERKQIEERLQYMADHDPLTGLLNRRRFEIDVAMHMAQTTAGAPGAVLVLDIDHFKQINDTLGPAAGDELISRVGGTLREALRESDLLARLGGDEFAVLLPATHRVEAEKVAAKLSAAVRDRATVSVEGRERTVTISIGVTAFTVAEGVTAEEVIVDADLAMYDAKEAGRDGFAFFAHDQEGHSRTKARMTWVDRIERAILDGGFVLDAQPILHLRTEEITHFELLLRMLDPAGDRIPPGAFLPVAERHGLIGSIDRWVIHEAIAKLARVLGGGLDVTFELNLSGHSIGDPQLLDTITEDIHSSGVNPANLIFEITETAAVADVLRARRFAQALSDLGCRFALDDFGAGFGSFYYLKHLPFDYLKIDGEFVRGCVGNRTDQLVIEAVVQIATGLGKATVAEFVADGEIRRVVESLGVTYAQGAHVSMPLPLDQALALAEHPA